MYGLSEHTDAFSHYSRINTCKRCSSDYFCYHAARRFPPSLLLSVVKENARICRYHAMPCVTNMRNKYRRRGTRASTAPSNRILTQRETEKGKGEARPGGIMQRSAAREKHNGRNTTDATQTQANIYRGQKSKQRG